MTRSVRLNQLLLVIVVVLLASVALTSPLSVAQSVNVAGITSSSWTWLGPGDTGGRMRSILILNPTQSPPNIWVGGVSGGIWKTANGGISWQPLNDSMPSLFISSMARHPNDLNIVYVGTGESQFSSYDNRGVGILKTTNGGASWSSFLSSTSTGPYVNQLAIAWNGTYPVLLAATENGIWSKVDDGTSNWIQTYPGVRIMDVEFNPYYPSGSIRAVAGGFDGRIYYFDGTTWDQAQVPGNPGTNERVELAYARNLPTPTIYASVNRNNGELWKSVNGGMNFTAVNTGNQLLTNQGHYNNTLWVDPLNVLRVVVGGVSLLRSNDGGVNFSLISDSSIHVDHHVIATAANHTIYVGNDGGIYQSSDISGATVTWQELNNGLGITQFNGVAGNPNNSHVVGGAQDNGLLRYTGNAETWNGWGAGDGMFVSFDLSSSYIYGDLQRLKMVRSPDGLNSERIDGGDQPGCKPVPYCLSDTYNSLSEFRAPVILDPNNPARILAGGQQLWKTDDARTTNTPSTGPSWASIKAPTSTGKNITALAISKNNSNIIWVGHKKSGELYFTSNGMSQAPAWTRVTSPSLPSALNRAVMWITIDPNSSNIVYITYDGFNTDNIWRINLANGVANDVTGSGFPDVPVYSLTINPNNSNWLYAGTEEGVYASEDSGANWSLVGPIGPSPSTALLKVRVIGLSWKNNTTLLAATYGRGVYQATVSLPSATNTPSPTLTPTLTPTPTSTPVPSDLIFANGFESGFTGWNSVSNGGGDMVVSSTAAMIGTYGLLTGIDQGDSTTMYVRDDTPNAETRYRARFYFDPNSIVMGNNEDFILLYGYNSANIEVVRVEVRRLSFDYNLRAGTRDDAGSWQNTLSITISDAPHVVELDWKASTATPANGSLTFWVDDIYRHSVIVDNDTRRVDYVRLGAVAGIDTGTYGIFYLDAFESRRQTYIGPINTSSDLVFADGFERGDFSAWSVATTGGGDLSVTPAAALVGGYGMRALVNDTTSINVRDNTPNTEIRYRARFYFDPNTITMTSGNYHVIFEAANTVQAAFQIVFRYTTSAGYQMKVAVRQDDNSWVESVYYPLTDTPHFIEVDWRGATASGLKDGSISLWADGVLKQIILGIDNDTYRIDTARLGEVSGLDSGTSGINFFDAFETRRQTYIGPVANLTWTRSHEIDTINGGFLGNPSALLAGLSLATYPDNVWDQNKSAHWTQTYNFDIRRFKATFAISASISSGARAVLYDPYYSTDVVPINDNLYVYVNGVLKFTGGTNYPGIANGNFPETDGWYIPGGIVLDGFQTGQNVIDILTEERNAWGGLGYLTLRFIP